MQAQQAQNEKPIAKRKPGRPSLYRPDILDNVRAMVRAGMTREDLAKNLGISIATLCEWSNRYPEFATAIYKERYIADTNVASALYLRAMGQATKTIRKVVTREDGQQEVHETIETLPPDAQAARYWLNNRAPKQWRDRIEVTGADGQALAVNLSWLQGARAGRVGEVIDVPVRERSDNPEPGNPVLTRVSGQAAADHESGD